MNEPNPLAKALDDIIALKCKPFDKCRPTKEQSEIESFLTEQLNQAEVVFKPVKNPYEHLLLQLRDAIANKEACIATANRELALGGWLSNWEDAFRGWNTEIARIEAEINSLP